MKSKVTFTSETCKLSYSFELRRARIRSLPNACNSSCITVPLLMQPGCCKLIVRLNTVPVLRPILNIKGYFFFVLLYRYQMLTYDGITACTIDDIDEIVAIGSNFLSKEDTRCTIRCCEILQQSHSVDDRISFRGSYSRDAQRSVTISKTKRMNSAYHRRMRFDRGLFDLANARYHHAWQHLATRKSCIDRDATDKQIVTYTSGR